MMKYNKLNNTSIEVSEICLGTMTWGEQNTEADGHRQMDYAVSKGINFFDTAEMYSVPGRKETQGSTERIIGSWFKKTGKRDRIVLASKVTGPSAGLKHIRNPLNFSRQQIYAAIEGSLKRLETDYIDLYQLHWPERNVNNFGKLGYKHDASEKWVDNFAEIVETMDALKKEGKIRHWGLSNETPWGLMHFLQVATELGLPKPITIQNPYSLLNRTFEIGLAEISMRENIGLLAYSPLAFGRLTGKHTEGKAAENTRISLFPKLSRYNSIQAINATEDYVKLAHEHDLTPAAMALAFVNRQPFVASTIIGATNLKQLEENIGSIEVELTEEMVEEIERIHLNQPNPAP